MEHAYLYAMRAYLIEHDRAPDAIYSPLLDGSKSDFAGRILACCVAAKIDWC